jgi:hypothetical protein
MKKILKSCSDNKEKLLAVYEPNGQLTTNAEETLEVMAAAHFKDSSSDPPDDYSDITSI